MMLSALVSFSISKSSKSSKVRLICLSFDTSRNEQKRQREEYQHSTRNQKAYLQKALMQVSLQKLYNKSGTNKKQLNHSTAFVLLTYFLSTNRRRPDTFGQCHVLLQHGAQVSERLAPILKFAC
jgi:hypothetical protein